MSVLGDSQTIVSFGSRNSLLCRGGLRGSEVPRAFLPVQSWQVAKAESWAQGSFQVPRAAPHPHPNSPVASELIPSRSSRGRADTQGGSKLRRMALRLGFLFPIFMKLFLNPVFFKAPHLTAHGHEARVPVLCNSRNMPLEVFEAKH